MKNLNVKRSVFGDQGASRQGFIYTDFTVTVWELINFVSYVDEVLCSFFHWRPWARRALKHIYIGEIDLKK